MGGIRTWSDRYPGFFDRVTALGLFLLALVEVRWDDFSTPFAPLTAIAVTTIPVAFRRRYPLGAAVTVYLGAPILELMGGVPGAVIGSTVLVFHSVGMVSDLRTANRRRFWLLVPFGVTVLIGIATGFSSISTLMFFLIINPGVWAHSNTLRGWIADQKELEHQNLLLRDSEADRVQQAVTQERANIARELHDIVAHNMSVIVVQAGAAQRVITANPDAANTSLKAIEDAARQALDEMRLALGVMRETSRGLEPQPDLGGVEALVDSVRRAGLDATYTVSGAQRSLPPAVELSGYRIIQEALTNTLKHGGLGAQAAVELTYGNDLLSIEVLDTGLGRPSDESRGHGLIGIEERVALFGGKLQYGNRDAQGFFVTAEIPLMVSS